MTQKPPVQEKALLFGEAKGLTGVVSLPQNLDVARPAVIFLNAGLIHRVGPFRMNVKLARRIAGTGLLSLRMDQSGLGDSLPRPGDMSYEDRAVLDVREAMNTLDARYGVKTFVLIGLCAGALSAHRAALSDARVIGACLLDGYAYRTPAYYLYSKLSKATDPSFWRKAGERALTKLREKLQGGAPSPSESRDSAPPPDPSEEQPGHGAAEIFAQDWPPRDVIEDELDGLLSRGVRMLFVYTGGWSDYVHKDQFDEMFPRLRFRERAQVELYPEADHTYLMLAHREKMMARVLSFLSGF